MIVVEYMKETVVLVCTCEVCSPIRLAASGLNTETDNLERLFSTIRTLHRNNLTGPKDRPPRILQLH